MKIDLCPNCGSDHYIKSGIVNDRQRYKCKKCSYFFSVNKIGKKIDDYYVNKSLQLYLEGLTYRGGVHKLWILIRDLPSGFLQNF